MSLDDRWISLGLFLLAYLLFIFLPHRRTIVAVLAAAGIVALQAAGEHSLLSALRWAVCQAVNWNVMGIFVGTLFLADAFLQSRAPAYFAESIVNRSRSVAAAILWICALTGFLSAFVENVATVLIVAPIALELARKLKIDPTNPMIAIAVSSNLQGTATLIGDPPSMLLGGFTGMNFFDFFFYQGRPSIFFAVEIGALASFVVLYFVFRKHRETANVVAEEKVLSWFPTVLLAALIVALAMSSFFDTGFSYLSGLLCMAFGMVSLLYLYGGKENRSRFWSGLKSLDWDTTFFLVSIFILVAGLIEHGWIATFAEFLAGCIGGNLRMGFVLLVAMSVALSAFVDNVPYVAAMLPVAVTLSEKLGVAPPLLLFGLLIGASLGGNITPIGASANIVACGLLKKEGYTVSFRQFARIGLPFTIAAVAAAVVFVWFIWA